MTINPKQMKEQIILKQKIKGEKNKQPFKKKKERFKIKPSFGKVQF
jgi:hypothetical protein